MKKIFKHKKVRDSILWTWLISYIICTFLPFVTLIAVHTKYDSMLKNTVNEMNGYVSESIASNSREILGTIQRLYMEISTDDNFLAISELNNEEAFYDKKDYWDALEIVKRNNRYLNNIDFFYVYFERSDSVLCSVGLYDSKSFYQIYIEPAGVKFDEWKNMLKERYVKHNMVTETGIEEVTSYNTPMSREGKAIVSAQISKERFFSGLALISGDFLSDIYIFDKDGGLIFSNNNEKIDNYRNFLKRIEDDKDKVITSSDIATENTGVKLITVADKKIIFGDIEKLRNLTLILVLICVFLLCVSIPILLKRNYRPVRKIMDEFGVERAVQNEFTQIHNYIKEIIRGSEELGSERDEYYEEIKKFVIARLLSHGDNSTFFEKKMKNRDTVFPNKNFLAVVFDAGNTILFFSDEYNMSEREKETYLSFVIENVMSELLNTDGDLAYIVTTEKNNVALVNTGDTDVDEILRKLEYGVNFINENFQTQLTFAVSDLHYTVEEIHKAYCEAVKAMKHKRIFDFKSSVTYSEISDMKPEKGSKVSFELRNEQMLVNSIKSGNYEKAEEIIEEIFIRVRNADDAEFDYIKCIVLDLAAALLKVQAEYNSEMASNTAKQIMKFSDDIDELKNYLIDVTKELCMLRMNSNNSSRSLVEAVKEYIEENYSDSNLNIAAVANRFNFVPTYIAAIFKENEGALLGDYIHKVRLENAKKLIKERRYTIAEISSMCGFAHVRTFNRVFKKYEGITPREYLK